LPLLIAPATLVAIVAIGLAGQTAADPGRLPVGSAAIARAPSVPPAEPTSPLPKGPPLVNRFTIDDLVPAWSVHDGGPHRGRRLGGISNYRTDPYER
jgi:hypothetical protein